jgi:GT2 family glycosyltransferase
VRALDGAEALARRSAAAAWPHVTVAILAYNRRDELRVTLGKLRRLDYPALDVIVVDNASRDGTAAMLAREFPDVRAIVLDANVGVSGWNAALAHLRGDWALLLDDDCYVEGDALKRSVAAAEANRADLVSFRIGSPARAGFFFDDVYATGLLSFWGCAALVRRETLQRLGGYDPEIFLWANELELTLRLLDAGYRHLRLPDVVAQHMTPLVDDVEFSPRSHALNHRHWAYIAAKSLRAPDAARVLARIGLILAIDAARISPSALTRTLPEVLRGIARGLRRRAPVRPEVSATYRANFHSFANPLEFVRRPGAHEAFRRRRERFYPSRAAVLEL